VIISVRNSRTSRFVASADAPLQNVKKAERILSYFKLILLYCGL